MRYTVCSLYIVAVALATRVPHLKLQHGPLHALHIKEKPHEVLNGGGQLGPTADALAEPGHAHLPLLAVVDLQGVELVGVFDEVAAVFPRVACLVLVESCEVTDGRRFGGPVTLCERVDR